MLSLSNSLSLLRAPLAFLFLMESTALRVTAILLAMLTDCIDGYLARKRSAVTKLGAILDPATDKFFVIFALTILLVEGRLETWQAISMISRDFSLLAFGIYLRLAGHWDSYSFKAIRWGKATTALQFIVLIALTFGYRSPSALYCVFILFGVLAFIELFLELSQYKKTASSRTLK